VSASIEVTTNNIPLLLERLPDAVEAFLSGLADQGLVLMQGFTPVDTGELRDSEHIDHPDPHTWYIVAGTDHAWWVHFGTYKMPARPFVIWTADALRVPFQAGMAALIPGVVG
jgi:hypothetical protein